MTIRYLLARADRQPVELVADPRDPATLGRLATAVVELQGRERATVRISVRLVGPEHIAGPLNLVMEQIEAARAGKKVQA